LAAKAFSLIPPRRGGQAEHLADEQVVVGQVGHAIPVGVQAQAHNAQHQDLPQVHAGASGGLFTRQNFAFEQGENPGLERGMNPKPLQTGKDGRQFVAAPEWQANLFDGCDLEIGLGLERMAHGG
jgi:hypothetical protein